MRKLKQKSFFSLPNIFATKRMELGPIPVPDDDELSQAIENDAIERDNAWELNERPDVNELAAYWRHVEQDGRKEAQSLSFSED